MTTVAFHRTRHKNPFDVVAEPFLQDDGLPFSEVLSAESIQRVFREEEALFGQNDIYSTAIVLWAFLAQTLRDGKGAACAAAVADIATYMLQTAWRPPSGDTGDYCRARAKLSLPALRRLVVESAGHLERDAPESWLWKGLHAKLVDGFTFTMPDTSSIDQTIESRSSSAPPGRGLRGCALLHEFRPGCAGTPLVATTRHPYRGGGKKTWRGISVGMGPRRDSRFGTTQSSNALVAPS